MSAARKLNPVSSVCSEIIFLNGIQRGKKYEIAKEEVVIGRSRDCDVIISEDKKCSRQHAVIKNKNSEFFISNLSENKPLVVNGKSVTSINLKNGDKIVCGSTQIVFNQNESVVGKSSYSIVDLSHEVQNHYKNQSEQVQIENYPNKPPSSVKKKKKVRKMKNSTPSSGRVRFYVILGVVGFIFWIILNSDNQEKKTQLELRTTEQIAEEQEQSKKIQKDYINSIREKGKLDHNFIEAQTHYLTGFRDYQKGQYSRAIQSFQAALAIYPNHQLAYRYLTLSKKRFDEMVQFNMIQGRRYRQKNYYRRCMSSFENVMTMLRDPREATYKEAQQLFNECSTMLEGRY